MNIGREYELTKKKQGRLTVGSGSKWFDKGDLSLPNFLLELKATAKKSYSLKKMVLEKIKGESLPKDKHWGMLISIDGFEVLVVDPSWLEVLNGIES